jgi:hypothetical protein
MRDDLIRRATEFDSLRAMDDATDGDFMAWLNSVPMVSLPPPLPPDGDNDVPTIAMLTRLFIPMPSLPPIQICV